MAARLPFAMRAFARPAAALQTPISRNAQRSFQTNRRLLQDAAPAAGVQAPVVQRKPVGAFRGTLFGFLLGSVLAGTGLYYYVIDEYKVSNELLTEDIYALQAAVQRIESYVKNLEEQVPKK